MEDEETGNWIAWIGKLKTTSDTKSEKPLVLLLKTENQMPKEGQL